MSVKRRRPEAMTPVPERLARFVPSEWPQNGSEDDVWAWGAEREQWALANQVEFWGYLTSPIGDRLDRLRARREAWLLNCTERDLEEPDDYWLWLRRSTAGTGSVSARRCTNPGSGSASSARGALSRCGPVSGSSWVM